MSSRGYPKRSARATGVKTYSTSRRARRSGAGSERGVVVATNLGVPAVAWTKVLRHPSAPLDAPYFGRRPKASFKVPVWVRVDELTAEEKEKYDEVEKKRDEQRAQWKKEMENRKSEPDEESTKAEVENQSKMEISNDGMKEAPTQMKSEPLLTQSVVPEIRPELEAGQEVTQQTVATEPIKVAEVSTNPPVDSSISDNAPSTSNGQ